MLIEPIRRYMGSLDWRASCVSGGWSALQMLLRLCDRMESCLCSISKGMNYDSLLSLLQLA